MAEVEYTDYSQQHRKSNNASGTSWPSTMLQVCISTEEMERQLDSSGTSSCFSRFAPSIMLCKKVGAEFVGTFLLILAAEGAAIMNAETKGDVTYIGVGLAAGLAVAIIILSIGHISGAHLNPAATLAFATIREHNWSEVPLYVITQLVASIFASVTLKAVLKYDGLAGLTVPSGTPLQAVIVEFIITFLMMFVATALSTDKNAVRALAGPAVGASVFLNNILAGALTGASMNPVRTLGPAIVSNSYDRVWVYIVGPTLGAITGSAAYVLLCIDQKGRPQKECISEKERFGMEL